MTVSYKRDVFQQRASLGPWGKIMKWVLKDFSASNDKLKQNFVLNARVVSLADSPQQLSVEREGV